MQTVRGQVETSALGQALAHEHVVVSNAEFARFYPELCGETRRPAAVSQVVAQLQAVKDRGIDTIVDCTAFLHGRDVGFVQEVNAQVELNIVMSTGIYTHDELPHFLHHRNADPRDLLTDMFVRDIEVGIADSGVRAQMIKIAVDAAGVTPNIRRVLQASAEAAADTGSPITVHTHSASRNGLEVQQRLRDAGVDLSTVVVGHAGDSGDVDYLRALMDAGSLIGCDRFGLYLDGTPNEDTRVSLIAELCDEGYADRIVLGHDTMMMHDWGDRIGKQHRPTWVPTHVSDAVLPKLRRLGVSDAHIAQMMSGNIARLFSSLRKA